MFKDRLQELIIAKTKKKVGPEYDDDEEENGEQAITAPDGLEGTGKQGIPCLPRAFEKSLISFRQLFLSPICFTVCAVKYVVVRLLAYILFTKKSLYNI